MLKMIILSVLLACVCILPTAAQDATPEATPLPEELTAMFDYDQSVPLNVQIVSSEVRGAVTIQDITYPSPVTQKPIAAYLVVPPGAGSFPAIIYVHWYEPQAKNSDRTEFLDEAVMMAQIYGVESILVSTMWSDKAWYNSGRSLDTDYDDAIRQVIELRRGIDVLLAQPQVDASHLAYVGHDFGAMYGELLSGVDHRAQAYVFMAGAANFNEWMLFGVPATRPGLAEYKAKMDTLAPVRFVAQAAPAAILFQFGTRDQYTSQADVAAFAAAAPSSQSQQYAVGHPMDTDAVRADRLAFLVDQLDLTAR